MIGRFACTASLWALAALLGSASDLRGQTPVATAPRPFRGVFGGSNPSSLQAGGLDAMLTLLGGYDSDLSGQTAPRPTIQRTVAGRYTRGSADITFERPGKHVGLSASAHVGSRHYPQLDDLFGTSYSGLAGMTVAGGGFRAALTQSVGLSPFYSLQIVPASAAGRPVDDDVNIVSRESRLYDTRVVASQQLTRRATFSGTFARRTTDFTSTDGDLTQHSGTVHLARHFTKYLALSAGYAYQEGRYSSPAQRTVRTHDVNIGTNYNRPHSRTRRTVITFSTGTSVVDDHVRRQYQLTGAAGFRHQMGRSWTAQIDYDRGVRHVEGFGDPFLSDNFSGTVSGLATRRLDTRLQIGYSTGVVGLATDGPSYTTYFGSAMLRFALGRVAAVQGDYVYYQYNFDRLVENVDLPRQLGRHGLRVGLAFWLPLVR